MSDERYDVYVYFKCHIEGTEDVDSNWVYGHTQIGTSSKIIPYDTLIESVNKDKFVELFGRTGMFDDVEFVTKEEYEENTED